MKKKILLFFLTFFAVASLAFYAAVKFGYFNVKSINVNGLIKLKAENVIGFSGIEKGQNIITVKKSKMRESLLKHPYIKDVYIEKDLPDSMDINIIERMEFFCVPYMGSYVIIDEEGMALRVENDITNLDRPILTGIDLDGFKIGKKIYMKDEDVLQRLLNLLNACLGSDILENISEINIDEESRIRLYTYRGIVVLVGEGENLGYKIPILKEILTDLYKKNINYGIIDMKHNGYPVYRQYGGEVIEQK